MTDPERFLLEQIRRGDGDAWGQLVERYQGRLLAFARSRGVKGADAEDLVQDTFLLFLRGLADFRGQASVETYLFVILRRRVIEHFRGKQTSLCRLTESLEGRDQPAALPAADPTASWYVRRDEGREAAKAALTDALRHLTDRLRDQLDFQSLQLMELLFYAQARNKEIASLLSVDEQHVALQKHRWIKQLRQRIAGQEVEESGEASDATDSSDFDSLMTEVWQTQRPTCPKRTTIGGYVLNSLDAPWHQYIDFHLHRLGCAFCQANLEDLQKQQSADASVLRKRIMQSTIGFLRV
ncbi:MAG TPA: sigma-70 family RNA polymerase sigma factor [Humisphaera sp.]|jgi:RNA polymerase sigma factor (sigma-70 family)|nr:sigma-70 family RNA polymerase sigma factor [Humisphaera sp.]